jgi:hypothetical protein
MPDFGIFRGFNDKLFGDKLYAGQLPTQLGLIGSEEVSDFDIDAQAFFDRVTFAGGTLSVTEQLAINTLVLQMKLDGIWTKMKAIYPMVGASAAACSQNLKSGNFTGIFTPGWNFSSAGITGNGSTTYMDTQLNGNSVLSLNSNSYSVYLNSLIAPRLDIPIGNGGNTFILPSYLGEIYARNASPVYNQNTVLNNLGLTMSKRTTSVGSVNVKNGSSFAQSTDTSVTIDNANFYLGSGNIGAFNSLARIALAQIGDGLTNGEASLFYNAVQAFQTTLGRQV